MTTKTRSEIPVLPPIKSPFNKPLPRGLAANEHALVQRSRPHEAGQDLESRVCMLEQAHKMLLEEIMNTQAHSHAWFTQHENECFGEMGGVRNSMGVNSTTLSHVLKQVSEMEKRVYHMQNQLDQMGGAMQRTRDDNISYQRDSLNGVTRQFKELERKLASFEEQLLLLYKEGNHQKQLLSHQMADVSSSFSSQSKSGAKAIMDLQKGLKEVENVVHTLAGSVSQANGISTHLKASQLDTTHQMSSRYDEIWSVVSDLQVRLSAVEAQRKRQDSWLKESFNELQEELTTLSASTSTALETVTSNVKKLDERSTAVERLGTKLDSSRESWKEERRTLENELMRGVNETLESYGTLGEKDRSAEASVLQEETTREVEHCKKTFEEHKKLVQKNLATLTKSLSLLEGESRVTKRELTRVMEAEIKTRREEVLFLQEQCSTVLESFTNTSKTLKLSLTALEKRATQNHNESTDAIRQAQDQWKEAHKHLLTDIGTRLSSLHIGKQERDSLECQIKNMVEQFDSLSARLCGLEDDGQFQEMKDNLASMLQKVDVKTTENSNKLHGIARNLQETQMKLGSQLQSESTMRFQEIQEIRNELAWVQSRFPQYPTITSTAPPSFATPKYQQKISERLSGHNRHPIGEVTSPTPEPQSPHSSPSVTHKWRRSRKGRGTRQVMYALEPSETMGTFTSAAPTPVELRKILVNESGDYHDESGDYLNEDGTQSRQEEEKRGEERNLTEREVEGYHEEEMISHYEEDFDKEEEKVQYEEEEEFDTRGGMSQHEVEKRDGVASQHEEEEFDKAGGVSQHEVEKRDGVVSQHEEEEFDTRGGVSQQEVEKRDGVVSQHEEEEFDTRGGMSQHEVEKRDGVVSQHEEEFDTRGGVSQHEVEKRDGVASQHEEEEFDNGGGVSSDREGEEEEEQGHGSDIAQLPVLPRTSSVFVKDWRNQEEEEEGRDCWMNEWGLYQALRLLQMKNKLMAPVYRLRAERLQNLPE